MLAGHEEEAEAPLPAAFSEDAIAEEWAKRHSEDWRYVAQWGAWFKWRGDIWSQDHSAEYFHLSRQITREARSWPGCDALTKSDQLRLSSAKTAAAALQFIRSDRRVAASADCWDTQLLYLGVSGGVIDLVTGQMIEPQREQYITKRTTVAPKAGAPALWLEFLKRVTDDDQELMGYLQRFSGYSLTGETNEHAFAFLYGTGANGKTTFVQVLLGVLGDYGLTTGMETFAESKMERHSTEIARLRGARLVATEETATGARWNEGRIKRLTGGGRIAARFMRQDDFEFEPHFKLLIAGNHKPALRADEAMKRRVHLIPFTVTIPEPERDKDLQSKLRHEWPQILGWMLDGCAQWRERGLSPGQRIKDATALYIQSNDTLGDWLSDQSEPETTWTEGKVLYDSFVKWCDAEGEKSWSRKAWSSAMVDKGFTLIRKKLNGAVIRGFEGIRLKLHASPAKLPDYHTE